MASTSSPALSLSKLDFPFLSSQRNMRIAPFSLTFSKGNLHQFQSPGRVSNFNGSKSNGFVLFSSLNGQIGENNAPQVQVQSRYLSFSVSYCMNLLSLFTVPICLKVVFGFRE